jgi:hypothetical protein
MYKSSGQPRRISFGCYIFGYTHASILLQSNRLHRLPTAGLNVLNVDSGCMSCVHHLWSGQALAQPMHMQAATEVGGHCSASGLHCRCRSGILAAHDGCSCKRRMLVYA